MASISSRPQSVKLVTWNGFHELIKINPDNELLSQGNMLLPYPILTKFRVALWHHWAKMGWIYYYKDS